MSELDQEIYEARRWALHQAAEYGLECEVAEHFDRYIEAGDPPWQAANCALYDWDI